MTQRGPGPANQPGPRKSRLADLAVLGGAPAFDEPVLVGRPNIGDRAAFMARVDKMLDDRWLSNDGQFLRELEARLADRLQVEHCVAVCNATLGLQLVFDALELTGQVILPSFTFIATAHAVQWQRLDPVFCDIDVRTHNLDPSRVAELVTPETSAILGVHLWGRACDIDSLAAIGEEHGLHVVFDAAHALGSTYGGRSIGGFGAAEVFSFHATKFFNSFEGGAITTNDGALAARLRRSRNFGFDDVGGVSDLGINAKMSEVAAAMGLTSLESMDDFIEVNRRNHLAYSDLLEGLPGIDVIAFDPRELHNYQYVVIEVDEDAAGISRDQIHQVLSAEGVGTRRYFDPPCHLAAPYRTTQPGIDERLPNTAILAERVLQLPTGTAAGIDDISAISAIITLLISAGPEVASVTAASLASTT